SASNSYPGRSVGGGSPTPPGLARRFADRNSIIRILAAATSNRDSGAHRLGRRPRAAAPPRGWGGRGHVDPGRQGRPEATRPMKRIGLAVSPRGGTAASPSFRENDDE